jgi:hypothetical protein
MELNKKRLEEQLAISGQERMCSGLKPDKNVLYTCGLTKLKRTSSSSHHYHLCTLALLACAFFKEKCGSEVRPATVFLRGVDLDELPIIFCSNYDLYKVKFNSEVSNEIVVRKTN